MRGKNVFASWLNQFMQQNLMSLFSVFVCLFFSLAVVGIGTSCWVVCVNTLSKLQQQHNVTEFQSRPTRRQPASFWTKRKLLVYKEMFLKWILIKYLRAIIRLQLRERCALSQSYNTPRWGDDYFIYLLSIRLRTFFVVLLRQEVLLQPQLCRNILSNVVVCRAKFDPDPKPRSRTLIFENQTELG